jgi:hypothetical protein
MGSPVGRSRLPGRETQRLHGDVGADHARRSPAVPLVSAHVPLPFAGAACRHQHQHDGDFGGRLREDIRGVGHYDTESPAGLQIDVAHSHIIVSTMLQRRTFPTVGRMAG